MRSSAELSLKTMSVAAGYDLLANEWDETAGCVGLDLPVMLNDMSITEDTPPPVEDDSPAVS